LKELINDTYARRVVLVVDQFEEVFTLCNNVDQRETFFKCLLDSLNYLGDKFCLVLALRADFLGKCAEREYSGLARMIQEHLVTATPMTDDELKQAIKEPAKQCNCEVEQDLVDALVKDVKSEPGSLPLLQYTLKELWEKRIDKMLTYSAYEKLKGSKGINGILEKHANKVYDELSEEEKEVAKYIFIELTGLGDGTGDTRKKIKLNDLLKKSSYEEELVKKVKDILTENNLVIAYQEKLDNGEEYEVVNLAHEVLIHHWTKLRSYLDEHRGVLPLKEEIERAAEKWEQEQEVKDFLYTSKELKKVEIIQNYQLLNAQGQRFIEKSKKHQTRKKLYSWTLASLIALIIAFIAGFTVYQNNELTKFFQSNQSIALTRYSDVLFRKGEKFDAILEGLRAAIPLQKLRLYTPEETIDALRRALYGVKERNRLQGHIGKVYSLSFSPDNQILASGSLDKTIKIWDVNTGKKINTLKGHDGKVYSVNFSPVSVASPQGIGQILASGSLDTTIKLWNATTGEEINTLRGHSSEVNSISFSPNGKILASGSLDKTIKLWNVAAGEEIKTLKGHTSKVNSISFSPDGKTLASGSEDGTVRLWNLDTYESTILSEDDYFVYSVSFSADGKTLASGGADGTIRLWDLSDAGNISNRQPTILNRHDYSVYSVSFSKDGKILASGSFDNTIKLWDVAKGKEISTVTGHSDWILNVSFSPDSKILASAAADGTIKIWDVTKIEENTTFIGHTDWINSVSFDPKDKTRLASGSADGTIKIWDVDTGKEKYTIYTFNVNNAQNSRKRRINSISFSPNGKILASSSADGFIQLWDAVTGKAIKQKPVGHNTWINSVIFTHDSKKIVFSTLNSTVQIWDLETDKVSIPFEGSDGFSGLSFSPDGKILAAGCFDNTIKLWNFETSKVIKTLEGHTSKVNSISFSPVSVASPQGIGKILASGSFDNTIKLWNLETGEVIKTLEGHNSKVYSVSFSPNGKLLASSSADKTIKLWDVSTGKEIKTFTEHIGDILSIAFSPDGKTLASGSADEKVMLWKVPENNAEIAEAEDSDANQLIKDGCKFAVSYLRYNPNVSKDDRDLCNNIDIQ
jgi:WD40 repeat protein